ncbi:NHLP bacteriocin export ABC transporter permease/ATPase subunit [Legionella waltersii]|uniref:ABC transporter n=1 Tax=Legionella waltersii TaxID=66969 RepID=A0A0W1A2B8_9GAMM|nr:NHLP bacteriocin export ABC transporter permease/ATPase subunit [Legionella waltersii]KTD75487.1 ABC transporter [Legionella waltersii]SNU98273.1 ABC transporter [Legionella waltersii]
MTKTNLEQFLHKKGKSIAKIDETDLNDETTPCCFYVVEGTVDLFLTETVDTLRNTSLKPLCSLNRGHFIFSKPSLEKESRWIFHAKCSPNAQLIQISLRTLELALQNNEIKDDLIKGINAWISLLSKSIYGYSKPGMIEPMPKEGTHALQANIAYTNETQEIVWLRLHQGSLKYLGNPIRTDSILPIDTNTWISSEESFEVEVYSFEQVLHKTQITPAILSFNHELLSVIINEIKERERIENQQFNRGIFERSTSLNHALQEISNFYTKDDTDFQFEEQSSTSIACCQYICKLLGIHLLIPQEMPSLLNDRAKVDYLLNNSQIPKRQVVLAGEWWSNPHGLLIGFLEESNQAVLLKFDKKLGYQIINLKNGSKTTVDSNIAQTLSPFALSVYRSLPNRPMNLIDIMRWSLFTHKTELKLVLTISVITGFLGLFTPWATGQIFSEVIPSSSYSLLSQLLLGLIAFGFGLFLFEVARSYTLSRIMAFIDNSGVSGLWDRVIKLPISFFQQYGAGDLLNRASGFQLIVNQLFGVAAKSIFDSTYLLFYFLLLFYYSSILALVSLAIMLFTAALMFYILKQEIKISRVSSSLLGDLSSMLAEYISGIQKIMTTASQSYVFDNWSNLFVKYRKTLFRSSLWFSALSCLQSVVPILSSIIIFIFAAPLIYESKMGLGGFLAFNAAFGSLLAISMKMTGSLSSLLNLIPTYERIKPILNSMPEVQTVKKDPGKIKGNIEVDHLFFKYDTSGPLILKDVSFKIEEGQFVAIVGPSGSGKSTLFRLLLQFENPLSGSIFFEDQSLIDLDINMVRRQIGVVLQNSSIFPGSIFENIIGSAPLTLDDAWTAAKLAGFDKDIKRMPMGMHTMISEGTGGLSGGQKQRLIIARALVNRPQLLFFDEATSALDNETQQIVTDSLSQINATRIVVAHRLSTIIDADKIIVLVNGQIEEVGDYHELMARKGVFHKMALRQIL